MIIPLTILAAFSLCQGTEGTTPTATTPLGKYQGSTLTTVLGKTINCFRGIRYAEPPVDSLRFKPPVPIQKHTRTYNATEDGPVCPQPSNDPVSEDCLFLNVYTTQLPTRRQNSKRPVIIHLHPGAFYGATGRSNWGGPQYFLDQEIVLVTLNYRLGVLGFLSMGTKEAPGNLGLKDQVVALRWVRDNIAGFGGDPNSVTIFGYSAGGMSVSMHLVSPMSRGLFHRAIIGSSSTMGQFPLGPNQLDVVKRQAKAVGCPNDTPKNILECLKTKDAEELGRSLPQVFEFGYEPVLLWKPVIEEDFGQERFLTEHPIKSIREGKAQKVPIMSGITSKEFGYKAFDLLKNDGDLKLLNDEWEKNAPVFFLYERDTERSRSVSRGLKSFYFNNKPIDNSSFEQVFEIYNEAQTGFAVNRGVKLYAQKNTKPVYYYCFTYKGRYSHYYLPGTNNTETFGPVHHDDLIYLFYISTIFPKFKKTDPEYRMVDKLTTLYANFARTGKPIPETCGKMNYAEWEPYDTLNQKYMDIGQQLVLKTKLFEDRYSEWEKLFPLEQYNEVPNISY